jgi:hypothetical protein
MLHVINSLDDPLLALIKDDPVRPDIPREFRVGLSSQVFVLLDADSAPEAVVCCAYRDRVPDTVAALLSATSDHVNTAVFYTIWSYRAGAGRQLIRAAREWIRGERSDIKNFVTLSPPTEMARLFHLRNGASVFRVNLDSVNYLYP